ncbi:MAG: DNA-directed RNA polymerase subunit alpha [Phycisphaerae bacterium]
MRIRWRGLELPGRILRDETPHPKVYGRFTIEPFEQGIGTTIGNSLRRVLLSSLEGAAVTSIKIDGVAHEFSSMDGVLEDVTDIVLNIKGIILRLDSDGPANMVLERSGAGALTAGDIACDPSVVIINPEHHIATLTDDVPFRMELTASRGRGYATASDNRLSEQEIGVIPVDSVFSPVVRVRYRTEEMRVDDRTNYDRLILEVWTKGTLLPEDALVEAGLILRKHLNPFVMYHELGPEISKPPARSAVASDSGVDSALDELLDKPVSVLNLSVRASNCLEAARILTVRELVSRTEPELLRVRSFGKTSLDEVELKLKELDLSLGMDVGGRSTSDASGSNEAGSGSMTMPDASVGGGSGIANQDNADHGRLPGAGAGPMEVFTMGD